MSSNQKARIAFAFALVLLGLSGLAAGLAIFRLNRTEASVRHTYDVEVATGDVESALSEVGQFRMEYIGSGDPESLQKFETAISQVGIALTKLRTLTKDNPAQQALCDQLDATAAHRIAASRQAVELQEQKQSNPEKHLQLNIEVAKAAFQTAATAEQMRRTENRLLEQRSELSKLLFGTILGILGISFAVSACMFWFHYSLLNRELNERRNAEKQLRQLSLQLMRVQDEEHKRFARELHDGLGQTLAGAKMMVDALDNLRAGDTRIGELAALLGEAVSQTRTISYLFHPPFLDEIGFASAARWLIEGYAQRTGAEVSADIPAPLNRLPQNLELTLYRVLQEALNNVQRHSKSAKVEVNLRVDTKVAILTVRDYGRGIPSEMLTALQQNGLQAGVGLTGMKERVKEQGGELKIRSQETGTEITAKIPIHAEIASPDQTSAEAIAQTR